VGRLCCRVGALEGTQTFEICKKKRDSGEIGFCKRLKYNGIDGALLLHGIKQRDGEIAKEVAGLVIFVVGIGDQ